MDERPIGVFDSGIGGLTVVREMLQRLPDEEILYLGDTARVPYGPRGAATITRFALELARFLCHRDVKALVVACNSMSACAVQAIRSAAPVPVVDVIDPTVREAAGASRSGEIAVIGTVATITSGVYERLLAQLRPEARLVGVPCPLFVPIAEEGLTHHPVARLMAEEYLSGLRGTAVDTLILGCTHYPLLKSVLAETLGPAVALIDSAEPTVRALNHLLDREGLRAPERVREPQHRFCVTDASYKFMEIANRILGGDFSRCVEQVCVEHPVEPLTGRSA
ncbi:MAG: glutamate racemase [Armatimonadetes bacterium]|nr:glutamate racemase [Armatimonadota bacterium]